MKKVLIILALTAVAQFGFAQAETNYPAYTNGQYYVWSAANAAVATNALAYINGTSWFPVPGRNARTGKIENDHAKTTKWADAVQTRADGKVCFPRIPEKILDKLNVPQEDRAAFFTAFQPTVEVYQNDWFPVVEVEAVVTPAAVKPSGLKKFWKKLTGKK